MTKDFAQRFVAMSLVLAAISGFSACTMQREEVTEETIVPEEQTALELEGEQPVARQTGETQDLNNLQSGQPISYYTTQFERRGYQVQDVDYQNDRVVYDLTQNNRRHQVTLLRPEGQTRVERVETRELRRVAQDQQQDQEHQKVVQAIQNLEPGKRPVEYLTSLSQVGTIREYQLDGDRASVELEANNRQYDIEMIVNPNQQTVSSIEMDRNRIWEFPG